MGGRPDNPATPTLETDVTFPKAPRALCFLAVLTAGPGVLPAHAAETDPYDGAWHGSITPYGWLPGVTAKLRYSYQGSEVRDETDHDILDKLSGALMIAGDARKGDWGIYGDLDWVKFDNEKGRFRSVGGERVGGDVTLDTRSGLKGGFVTLAGLYSLSHGPEGNIDLLFGGRYLWLKGNLGWNFGFAGNRFGIAESGHLARNTHVTDALIGIRGRWTPGGGPWFFPYYADIGAGGSDLTSQLALGAGYAFHWGDVSLAWRYVTYRRDDDSFLERVSMMGPAIGLTWHF